MKNKKTSFFFIAIAGFIFATLASFGSIIFSQKDQNPYGLLIENLPADLDISYRIFVPEIGIQNGEVKTDLEGRAHFPSLMGAENTKHKNLKLSEILYDLKIKNDEAPVNLRLLLRPEKGEIKISGQGAQALSEIKTSGLMTRADWAGNFSYQEQTDIFSKPKNKNDEYQVAFQSHISNDAGAPSLLIKIAGGGGSDFAQEIKDNYVTALMHMTEQMTAIAMQQTAIIGVFFDAKMQLETQAQMERLQAQALKDYHPDELMCRFGTFVRGVAQAENNGQLAKYALNETLMSVSLNQASSSTATGTEDDMNARIKQFREVYCNPADNNNGLSLMCDWDQNSQTTGQIGGADAKRFNNDIDYQKVVGSNLTIDADFTSNQPSPSREDVMALARNLYWPSAFNSEEAEDLGEAFKNYMGARTKVAMANVAHASFAEIVGMKTQSKPQSNNNNSSVSNSGPFIKAMMKEFGLDDAQISQMLGQYPSYYAQMEVLTKKIYQSPEFYTNLYTKPVNIERINTSMQAISLMQMRDQYESSLRREMLTSLLVEEAMAKGYYGLIGRTSSQLGR